MSDDTPTQRFDAAGEPAPSEEVLEERKSRRLIIILASIGGALLLGVIVLLVVLLTRGGGAPGPTASPTTSPTPGPTPSASPSPSPTPAPPPTPTTDPTPPPAPPSPIQSFDVDSTTVDCSGGGPVPMQFSWVATGETLYFGVGTDNAKNAPYGTYPLIYTLDIDYQCGQPGGQQRYTITVEQPNGDVTSDTITVSEG